MHMAYSPENMLHLYNSHCWVYISDIILKFIGTTCRFPTKYIYGHFPPLAKHVVVACSNSPSQVSRQNLEWYQQCSFVFMLTASCLYYVARSTLVISHRAFGGEHPFHYIGDQTKDNHVQKGSKLNLGKVTNLRSSRSIPKFVAKGKVRFMCETFNIYYIIYY